MRCSIVSLVWLILPVVALADVAAFLPPETDAVLTIQARRVAETDLGKKVGADLIKQALRASKPAATAVEATGLDPLKDFDVVTVGMDLDKTDSPKPFALFEGKFDTKKVEASVNAYTKEHPDRASAVTVGGKSAYKVLGGKSEESLYAAIINDSKMVIVPSENDLIRAFDAAAGTRKPVISKELAGVLMRTKSHAPILLQAWVKGKFDDLKIPNEKLQTRVRSVEWATLAIGVTKDVNVTVVLGTPDETGTQQLSDLLGGVIGLVRLQILAAAEDQPELMPVVDLLRSTKVTPSGKTVVATGSVKGEAIEKALNPPPAPKPAPKKK